MTDLSKQSAPLPFHERPFRPCIGIVVFNQKNQVFVGERADIKDAWQLPQGGISADEDAVLAGLRELEEETGISNVTPLALLNEWVFYDFPQPGYIPNHSEKYRGQKQKWLAVRFNGSDDEISLTNHEEIEFQAWKWIDLEKTVDLIVDFKKPSYQKAIDSFLPFTQDQLPKGQGIILL